MNPIYYFDSSALIKSYLREEGSDFVIKLLSKKTSHFTSSITYAETYATFFRLQRQGDLSNHQTEHLSRLFEDDWHQFIIIDFSSEIRQYTPALLKKSPLRGADTVQLVSAFSLLKRGLNPIFVSADKKLLNAAEDCGLKGVNPSDE